MKSIMWPGAHPGLVPGSSYMGYLEIKALLSVGEPGLFIKAGGQLP